MSERFVEVPLDVRDDPEVLFDARAQLAALTPQLHRVEEALARRGQSARGEVESTQRVQGLCGEQIVAGLASDGKAPVAKGACDRRLVTVMAHDC